MKLGKPETSDENDRLDGKPHFIFLCPERKHKDCIVCSNRKIFGRIKINFFYKMCKWKLSLHPENCFERYYIFKITKSE